MKLFLGFVVILLLVTGAVLNQRGYFDPPKVEVTSFKCEATSPIEFVVSGSVKNISDQPLTLQANVAMEIERFPEKFTAAVKPQPLAPGARGRFIIRERLARSHTFGGGDCRLDPFKDEAGKSVKFTMN